MSLAGYACQLVALLGLALIGRPEGASEGVLAVAMLALFLFGQGFGPGAHTMTFASLSYPTSPARRGRGPQPDADAQQFHAVAVSVPAAGRLAGYRRVLGDCAVAVYRPGVATGNPLGAVGV